MPRPKYWEVISDLARKFSKGLENKYQVLSNNFT